MSYIRKKRPLRSIVLPAAALLVLFFIGPGVLNSVDTYAYVTEPSGGIIKNPLIGYAPYASEPERVGDSTLVYVGITWREAEPAEGRYDFAAIEEKYNLKRWREEGKRVVFRFICDYPGKRKHLDIPDWLYKLTGDGAYYDCDYGKGYSPNYANPVFIEKHKKVITAFGKYYGGKSDFFAYIELGSLGHWGEWHVDTENVGVRLPDDDVRHEYVLHYMKAFPSSMLLMRRPFSQVKLFGLGIYNDMTGDGHATDRLLEWIDTGGEYSQTDEEDALVAVSEPWINGAFGGELAYGNSMSEMLGEELEQTLELVGSTHMTFIGPNCPTGELLERGFSEGADAVEELLGYRLRVSKAVVKEYRFRDLLSVSIELVNDGIAPMYFDWPVCLYLVDDFGNAVTRHPLDLKVSDIFGDTTYKTTVKFDLSGMLRSELTLCIGIEDPLTGEPSVTFASSEAEINGMAVLHELRTQKIGTGEK